MAARPRDLQQVQADEIRAKLQKAEAWLAISDDGCGFDPAHPGDERRFGLRCMRERAEVIGATFSVESQTGQGTRISVCYPDQR